MKDRVPLQQLLEKYLSGRYTGEELDALLEQFQDEDSRVTLEELTEDYLNRVESSVNPQQNQRIQKLLSKTDQTIRKAVPIPTTAKKHDYRWSYAAAAILVCVSIGLSLYLRQQAPSDMPVLISEYGDDVLPGGNRAYLTLSDGQVIQLREDKVAIQLASNDVTYEDGSLVIDHSIANIEYITLTTPRGGQYQVSLPDGSKVLLNAASSLRYPMRFEEQERKVELNGEGYFEVAKNETQPFIVSSGDQTVKVLGTTFNIHAYGDAPATTLLTGRVEVNGKNNQRAILEPGEQSSWKGAHVIIQTVDTREAIAWRNGLIAGSEMTLEDITPQIERWYDVDFRWDGTGRNKEKAYISINRNEKLSAVLEAIELIYGVHFTVKGKEVVIEK